MRFAKKDITYIKFFTLKNSYNRLNIKIKK